MEVIQGAIPVTVHGVLQTAAQAAHQAAVQAAHQAAAQAAHQAAAQAAHQAAVQAAHRAAVQAAHRAAVQAAHQAAVQAAVQAAHQAAELPSVALTIQGCRHGTAQQRVQRGSTFLTLTMNQPKLPPMNLLHAAEPHPMKANGMRSIRNPCAKVYAAVHFKPFTVHKKNILKAQGVVQVHGGFAVGRKI